MAAALPLFETDRPEKPRAQRRDTAGRRVPARPRRESRPAGDVTSLRLSVSDRALVERLADHLGISLAAVLIRGAHLQARELGLVGEETPTS